MLKVYLDVSGQNLIFKDLYDLFKKYKLKQKIQNKIINKECDCLCIILCNLHFLDNLTVFQYKLSRALIIE